MSNDEIYKIKEKFDGIYTSLNTFKLQVTSLNHQVKIIEKNINRELSNANKIIERNKTKPKRKPSGFAVKVNISEQLLNFMGLDENEKCARTEVTKYIIKYIKDNNLQNSHDKRIIEPNDELQKLLLVKEGEELTYFTLQRYMNRHFKQTSKKN
tara:strand:- start:3248 stop:3709 length:462 start_codon:yes stop_codon:yes gene_type:complete